MKTTFTNENLRKLYDEGRSMKEIADIMQCSIHKVVYWMEKHNIKRRSLSDALYFKLNPHGDPFKIKTDLSKSEKLLFGLGIGIYWGEGEKTSKGLVRITNSDPIMIRIFMKFLLDICQLREDKLLFQVICFNDSKPDEARRHWANQLGTSEQKFGKIVQIPNQGKGTYRKKSDFGVCILAVASTKLKAWIMNEIRNFNSPEWLSGRARTW